MFARFDENPAITLQDIKKTKRYGRTDRRTDGRTHGRTHARTDNVKTVYPPQTKFAGGIITSCVRNLTGNGVKNPLSTSCALIRHLPSLC